MGRQIISLPKAQVITLYGTPKFWAALFPEEYFIGKYDVEVSKMN
jgi:hypothetical protein